MPKRELGSKQEPANQRTERTRGEEKKRSGDPGVRSTNAEEARSCEEPRSKADPESEKTQKEEGPGAEKDQG